MKTRNEHGEMIHNPGGIVQGPTLGMVGELPEGLESTVYTSLDKLREHFATHKKPTCTRTCFSVEIINGESVYKEIDDTTAQ